MTSHSRPASPVTNWRDGCSFPFRKRPVWSRSRRICSRFYGADSPNETKAAFARNCILARRLVERGVRFVQLFNGAYASGGRLNWDGHSKLKEQYDVHGEILDQPVAGLLRDLKQRGLLESTLVLFCTEFGRMPMFQAGDVRPGPQSVRLHLLARRGGRQGAVRLRSDRRVRIQGSRERADRPRPARNDSALARPRPQAADVLSQRHS